MFLFILTIGKYLGKFQETLIKLTFNKYIWSEAYLSIVVIILR